MKIITLSITLLVLILTSSTTFSSEPIPGKPYVYCFHTVGNGQEAWMFKEIDVCDDTWSPAKKPCNYDEDNTSHWCEVCRVLLTGAGSSTLNQLKYEISISGRNYNKRSCN